MAKKVVRKVAKKPMTKKIAVTTGKPKRTAREIEIPVSNEIEIQDGIQPSSVRTSNKPPLGIATIGSSFGITINMDNFESARVDVFIQRNVVDTDEEILKGYEEIGKLLQDEIERQSSLLVGE